MNKVEYKDNESTYWQRKKKKKIGDQKAHDNDLHEWNEKSEWSKKRENMHEMTHSLFYI